MKSINEMTVRELRETLMPYGTPHRLSMTRAQLRDALSSIRENELRFGSANRPKVERLYDESKGAYKCRLESASVSGPATEEHS